MSPSVILPAPLPTGSISVGQLITDPLQQDLTSFTPSKPNTTFSSLRNDSSAQSFLLTSTLRHREIYFVTGVQSEKTNTNTTITSAKESESLTRPSTHVRRMDSAVDLESDSKEEDSISALELRSVRCRVGYASEPHSVDDVEYTWTYHALNDDGLQLSIGLGKAVDGKNVGNSKKHKDEDVSDESWSYGSDDDDEGLGGF